ncbi:SET domain-containing protein [Sarcoptes scabiei]|uniref:SET domain-containing protein n=1 Tax=Sarcoptes scabiei TaxID=52283 RepID=A0A132A7Z7_SARSC|nr:SET domain-containing protein [Sarcoptes scabiei]
MNSTFRNDLMHKLLNDSNYEQLKTNKDRLKYVFENYASYDHIRSIASTNRAQINLKNQKQISTAKNYKMEGDLHLLQLSLESDESIQSQTDQNRSKKNNLIKALKSYTKAILFVPFYEDVLLAAKLYASKCQVHLHLQEYDAALYSVEIAIESLEIYRYDPKCYESLKKYWFLKINCLRFLQKYREALDYLDEIREKDVIDSDLSCTLEKLRSMIERNLTDIINPKFKSIPIEKQKNQIDDNYYNYCLDSRCTILQSPVVGRHFIANDVIYENTIILIERPYSIIIENEYLRKKCSNCFKELGFKFFPCLYCTELIFCDRKCFEETYKLFHRHECGIVSLLKSLTSPAFHVFRMISRLPDPFLAFEIEQNKQNYSIDHYLSEKNQKFVPESSKTLEEKSRAYKMSSLLWDHDSKHSGQTNVHHVVIGIEVACLLDLVHQMNLDSKSIFLDFIAMIVVDIRRIVFNVFGWHEYNQDWSLRGHVANCQCLVGSLINHSCVPNTNWEFQDGWIRFITNRTITKGEEITITYGPNKEIAYDRRQERLNHYFFACHCAICLQDAKRNKSLKCLSCQGPVPFEGAVNQEPLLNGQCLVCFTKYPNFDPSINEYKKCLDQLALIDELVQFSPNRIWLDRAQILSERFVQLATKSNENIVNVLMMLTRIAKICYESNQLPSDRLLMLAEFVDERIPIAQTSFDCGENINGFVSERIA